ncbi:MAG: response regulator [Spirochaetales bacterium]|nr:response regulator [Spirochaetales bacterium]
MERDVDWRSSPAGGADYRDPATGLLEHSLFLLELEREFRRSQRSGEPFTVALIEVAGLDACGSAAAAEMQERVAAVGEILRGGIRDVDLASRCDRSLFGLLLLKTSAEVAHIVGERVRRAVEERFHGELSVSIGMASFPVDAVDRQAILSRATDALREAVKQGLNQVYYFTRPEAAPDPEQPRVLVVDDDRRNVRLISSYLLTEEYEVLPAYSGEEAMSLLGNTEIDLVLLDIMMPGVDGYQVCKRIKSRDATRMVPVVLLTALDDTQAKLQGIECGADDFVTKPANREELLARARALIRVRGMNKNLTSIENALFALASAVEAKDNYTLGHTQRVANLAVAVGRRLGLREKEIFALRIGGILHDVGKIGISEEILNKPGKLDEREWEIMRSHPEIGYRICLPLKATLGLALDVVRHHHEKLDGSSYPDGLSGDQISMAARILCVADIYDALVTARPYRPAMPKARALEILHEEVQAGKLDPAAVAELADLVG